MEGPSRRRGLVNLGSPALASTSDDQCFRDERGGSAFVVVRASGPSSDGPRRRKARL